MGVDDLINQAGLAHARSADNGHHPSMPRLRPCQCLPDDLAFSLSAHRARQAMRHRCVQALAHYTGPDQLEHLNELRQPFRRDRSQGVDAH
jgi:hypothetical protein